MSKIFSMIVFALVSVSTVAFANVSADPYGVRAAFNARSQAQNAVREARTRAALEPQNMMRLALSAVESTGGGRVIIRPARVKCEYTTAKLCIEACLDNGVACMVNVVVGLSEAPEGGLEADPEVFACAVTPQCQNARR